MMCLSNYDLGLAGVDDDARADVRAGAGKAYISIRKLNCKLKWPSMFKKTLLQRLIRVTKNGVWPHMCKRT